MAIISGGNVITGGNVNGDGTNAPFTWAAAPTNGGSGTYVGKAVVGSRLRDLTNGTQYVAAATTTSSTVTWTLVTP